MKIEAYDIGTKVYIIGVKSDENKRDHFDIIGDGTICKILIDDKGLHYGINDVVFSFSMRYYDPQVVFDDITKATSACIYYNENYDKITLDTLEGGTEDED